MTPLPNIEAYPKTLMLRDGSKVEVRPLKSEDKIRLVRFFERIPEEDRHYLRENVVAPEAVKAWTEHIDFDRVIPIVALAEGEIVADATLHRNRAPARHHMGEIRIVVDPAYREQGLGRRLIRELLDIAAELGLDKATFELVDRREMPAIMAARSVGFREVATLREWVRDVWGNYVDLVLLELPLKEREAWWRF